MANLHFGDFVARQLLASEFEKLMEKKGEKGGAAGCRCHFQWQPASAQVKVFVLSLCLVL